MFRTTVEVEVEVEEDNWVLQMLGGAALFLLLHYNVVQVPVHYNLQQVGTVHTCTCSSLQV